MNNGAEGSEYTNLMANDGKRLVDGYDFEFNSNRPKNTIFGSNNCNFSERTDTSFSLNSLMKLESCKRWRRRY